MINESKDVGTADVSAFADFDTVVNVTLDTFDHIHSSKVGMS